MVKWTRVYLKVKIWCLICGEKVEDTGDVNFESSIASLLLWVNEHLACPRCSHLPYYSNTLIKLGVIEVEEKLVKKSDEKVKQLSPPKGTV